MTNPFSHSLTVFRLTITLTGLFLLISGGFYFFDTPVESKTTENPSEQNLLNGKLAYSSRIAGPTVPDAFIYIANPDGSGQTTLPVPSPSFVGYPAWSPDGTKMAYAGTQSFELYVINITGGAPIQLTNTPNVREQNPSWSVTGKIAYERDPQLTTSQIWTVNPDGTGSAHFSAITQPFPFAPAWSPDGSKLAFVSGNSVWVINADGTGERRVTTTGTIDRDPAWSPDGTKIIFGKDADIAVINADGTNEATLTVNGSQPAWSPDGTKIAFRRGGIYTMDANGANQVRIAADIINFPQCCDRLYENPAWQPVAQTPNTYTISGRVSSNDLPVGGAVVRLSGTTNAITRTDSVGNYQFSGLAAGGNYTVSPSFLNHYFTPANRSFNGLNANQSSNFEVLSVCRNGRCAKTGRKIAFERSADIFTINFDGTNLTNITNNAAGNNKPDFSPDGTQIVFHTNRDGNNEIYRMNADGGNPVRLTNNTASDANPRYSPDGASIVFNSSRDGNSEIYKMNADGSNPIRLTNDTGTDAHPAFSLNGQKIIFVSNRLGNMTQGIFIMNADGSNQQVLNAPTSPSPFHESLSYSPDGSKIIFTYTPDLASQIRLTWTINADGTNRARYDTVSGSYGTFSPDGRKVVHTCCAISMNNRLRIANPDGTGEQIITPSSSFGITSIDWQPDRAPRPTKFDFDGDERADLSVFRPTSGTWYQSRSTQGFASVSWGAANDVIAPADYDGDQKTDIAVWRASDGYFYILNSFDNTVRTENFGVAGDIPVGGDWDGDGKADPAVYRAGAQSAFYYRGSMSDPQISFTTVPWGTSGDRPVVSDYDGDGKADAGVYRQGSWYILKSSDGSLFAVNFGLTSDTPVPADYDGDGKTDIAVYRGGLWYRVNSADGSFTGLSFGTSGDKPVPADYDGDGRADIGVFRPSDGAWYLFRSTNGFTAQTFGQNGDLPGSGAFIP